MLLAPLGADASSVLASKIGAALSRTHDYTKAINYYEAAVRNGELVVVGYSRVLLDTLVRLVTHC